MSFQIIQQNLLESSTKFIAHQCNCVTTRGANLAASVFSTFPYANIYSERTYPHEPKEKELPGNIIIRGNGTDKRYVINMLGQYYPGIPKFPHSKRDGFKAREDSFLQCLNKTTQINELESISFPYQIGCGAAGGDWEKYLEMLKNFEKSIKAEVVICRLV